MSKIVKVRDMKVGADLPKICIPITAKNLKELKLVALSLPKTSCDFIEWRSDFYANIEDASVRREALEFFRKKLTAMPILFTMRTSKEMGKKEITTKDYLTLNLAVIESGLIDMVDVELSQGAKVVKQVVSAAHKAKVKVILSQHDFQKTPTKRFIVKRLCLMQELGADIVKFAAMPKTQRDVLTLLDATLTMKEEHNETPIITMSMGKMGVISRICGQVFGSDVTFGTAGKASAPGQLPANQLSIFLKSLA